MAKQYTELWVCANGHVEKKSAWGYAESYGAQQALAWALDDEDDSE